MGKKASTTIYVALYGMPVYGGHDYDPIGVCSTRELAEAACAKHSKEAEGEYFVEEWHLDGAFIRRTPVYP